MGKIDPLEAVRQGRALINCYDAWLFREIAPYIGQRVLEVGCGHGNLVQHLQDRELVVAVDVDPLSVTIVKERFGHCHNVSTYIY